MIRTLSVIALGAALIWPTSASAQRAVRTTNNPGSTINRAPQGGALGTPGGPGPWVGGAPARAAGLRPVARARQNARGSEILAVPQYGYPIFNGGYYGIPTFSTGFDTGYYPPGVWPSPVVTPPIYPMPYTNEIIQPGITEQQGTTLANELARISQQLEDLRNQSQQPVPVPVPVPSNGNGVQNSPNSPNSSREKPAMATVLIMRDGRRIETQSYAITDQTLWVFDQGSTMRFALGELDVDATQKENSKRGIRFLVG